MHKRWGYRLIFPFILLQGIIVVGIVGYMLIEHYNIIEALYMTTLAVTTVGFKEVRTLSPGGQVFTTFLLIFSWGALIFILSRLTQIIVSGEINKYFKTRRLMTTIDKMKRHVIVCGLGRNGQQAARTLKMHNVPFLIVEKREEMIEKYVADNHDAIYILGDGTEDEVLLKAGVERADALITALPTDSDNVFIVLTARSLNPHIRIISRASHVASQAKLIKAGADSVILPDKIGGTHMATLVTKPDVIEFIDYLSGEEGESINMESVPYNDLPEAIKDKTLYEVMTWKKTGVNCIGIKSKEGKFVINPPENTIICQGMKVIVLGTRQQIEQMKGNLN
ncbi:MAG: potassium channel protein [Bacteroidetes bacterium]|nr:MAG: potassium channel protein [Bacteroidota bacterium]